MPTVEGHLEHITFHNPETHYTVARFRVPGAAGLVTLVGIIPDPAVGEALKVGGRWETHPKFGQQLKVETVEAVLPATIDGISQYLASGLIKGIGPKTARRLVDRFGENTLEVIEADPNRLQEIEGIGKTRAAWIRRTWEEHHAVRKLMEFLQKIGVKASFSAKLIDLYGPDALNIIREDPFRLAEDLPRIGFRIAVAVIRHLDFPVDPAEQARMCIMHLVRESLDEGHTWEAEKSLILRCREGFGIDPELSLETIAQLIDDRELVRTVGPLPAGETQLFLKSSHDAEVGIAHRIRALLSVPFRNRVMDPERMTEAVLKRLAIRLSPDQVGVLEGVLSHRISVITGGPGTGKTTLIRSLAAILEMSGSRVLLAAPTGRAARRLADLSGRDAYTLHKLLGYIPSEGRFSKNRDNPLQTEAMIVDEASMVDTQLMFHLLEAVPAVSMLVMVGDAYQLPAIGAGNVLADIIASHRVPVFYLTDIFRQEQESAIIADAHRVRQGERPTLVAPESDPAAGSFYFIEAVGSKAVASIIVSLCREEIPRQVAGIDPVRGIQVLTPMHGGDAGTLTLNPLLQRALNPAADRGIRLGGTRFGVGDKVMHLKNNYEKEVFNGDIGMVADIDRANRLMTVDYDGRLVEYDVTETDEIILAYAITVHKSQGSEYPVVVMPVTTRHYPMLQRNLIYTAMTRARHLAIFVGAVRALEIALKNNRSGQRRTGLAERLAEMEAPETGCRE